MQWYRCNDLSKRKIIKDSKIFTFPMFLVEVKEGNYVKILQQSGQILRLFLSKYQICLQEYLATSTVFSLITLDTWPLENILHSLHISHFLYKTYFQVKFKSVMQGSHICIFPLVKQKIKRNFQKSEIGKQITLTYQKQRCNVGCLFSKFFQGYSSQNDFFSFTA